MTASASEPKALAQALPLVWSDDISSLDWDELVALYRAAPLGSKNARDLQTAFSNSRFRWLVRDDQGGLVGAGRALSDGVDCAYLCDIAVHPSHQGTGLGKQVVQKLLDQCQGHRKIILYAVAGKEPFYKKFGFRRMLTAMAIFEDPDGAVARGQIDAN